MASAVRNAANAPEMVIAHGAPIPSSLAGNAIVYGAMNCIEKRDSGWGFSGESSRLV